MVLKNNNSLKIVSMYFVEEQLKQLKDIQHELKIDDRSKLIRGAIDYYIRHYSEKIIIDFNRCDESNCNKTKVAMYFRQDQIARLIEMRFDLRVNHRSTLVRGILNWFIDQYKEKGLKKTDVVVE